MTAKERKEKAKKLEDLVGEFVEMPLKNIMRMDSIGDEIQVISNMVHGYVIDVDEYYLYLGEDLSGYNQIIDLEEVGRIGIVEDIPEELLTIIPPDERIH